MSDPREEETRKNPGPPSHVCFSVEKKLYFTYGREAWTHELAAAKRSKRERKTDQEGFWTSQETMDLRLVLPSAVPLNKPWT